jgi:Protein of unknown function (DUF2585)
VNATIRRGHAAIAALILISVATIEWLSGRPAICKCGIVRFWAGTVDGPENSQQIADWYSLSHVLHGLLFYGALWLAARRWSIGTRLVIATACEAAWELMENSHFIIDRYRAETVAFGYSGDSILNSTSDIGWMILGFLIARRLPLWYSVALGFALELVALTAIRDNLTLNVLMLVHPIVAVRVWQAS